MKLKKSVVTLEILHDTETPSRNWNWQSILENAGIAFRSPETVKVIPTPRKKK